MEDVKKRNSILRMCCLFLKSFFSFPRWFAPSLDSSLLKQIPEKVLTDRDGDLIKVPILTGLARHEGAFYYPRKPTKNILVPLSAKIQRFDNQSKAAVSQSVPPQ